MFATQSVIELTLTDRVANILESRSLYDPKKNRTYYIYLKFVFVVRISLKCLTKLKNEKLIKIKLNATYL